MSVSVSDLDGIFKMMEIAAVVGSAIALFVKLGSTTARFELVGKQQASEIAQLKISVEKLGTLIVEVALQKQRLDAQTERLNLLDQRYEELRHGQGYVVKNPREPVR